MHDPGKKAVDFGKVGKTATESGLKHDKRVESPSIDERKSGYCLPQLQ